jgi:hypothetical protein
MEELPDEMALLVLSHIEPLRDTAAVSGTCRRWRRLMLDPHLWSLFHLRTFPTHLTTTTPSSTTALDGSASSAAAPEGGWRQSFAAAARLLKEAMTNPDDVEIARLYGYDVLPLAAARTGCLPLAERAMAKLSAAAAKRSKRAVPARLARVGYGFSRGLIDECLFRACTGGFAPIAQVRRHHQRSSSHRMCTLMMLWCRWWLQLFLGLGAKVRDAYTTHAAVLSGNRQLVALLLDHGRKRGRHHGGGGVGGSVWLRDPRVLAAAAGRGDVEMLRLLIARGATTQSLLAIAKAAQAGSVASVQLLIDSGFCFPPAPVRDARMHTHTHTHARTLTALP